MLTTDDHSDLIIQFAKSPVPGQVKTRLLPVLSPEQAAELHGQLLGHCAARIQTVDAERQLWVAGELAHPLLQATGLPLIAQPAGGLGLRMATALTQGLAHYRKVVIVGSDCPFIDEAYLVSAFTALDNAPVVLGPADDGGYVLIGARGSVPPIFEGIAWGTDQVLKQTRSCLEKAGMDWVELKTLADIDRPEDLALLAAPELRQTPLVTWALFAPA